MVKRVLSLLLAFALVISCVPNFYIHAEATQDTQSTDAAGSINVLPAAAAVGADYEPGDVNSDGSINSSDLTVLRKYIAGGYEDLTIDLAASDVNADGLIDVTDLILIRRFIAGGYDVELKPSLPDCAHTLKLTAAKDPTCTEDGNTAYYKCTLCGRYFQDADGNKPISVKDTVLKATGHTEVIDPAVDATAGSTGLTEGSHCSVCGVVIIEQEVIPPLGGKGHSIRYDLTNGDPYLEKLVAQNELTNPNPDKFYENTVLNLRNLSVPGYRFLGWFDGAGENASQVKHIEGSITYDIELYAHWETISYKVQYKSDLFLEKAEETYTVDSGLVLPTPKLSNYVFTGWSDEKGNLYDAAKIPEGTTGNITLTANWTSERYKTWTKAKLDDPIIHVDEERNVIFFAYEIGEIQNVPLYTIKDFGYISGDGVTKTETTKYATTISEELMKSYTSAISQATTESSNWTLSKDWNEVTSVNEEWSEENGYTVEEAEKIGTSSTNNWNVSSSSSGSKSTTDLTTNQDGWTNQAKVGLTSSRSDSSSSTHVDEFNREVHADVNIGYKQPSDKAGWQGGIEAGGSLEWKDTDSKTTSHTSSSSGSLELGGSKQHTGIKTDSTVDTTSWNSSSSYGGSATNSSEKSVSSAVSEQISQKYGYGKEYIQGGSSGSSQGLTSSTSSSDEYSASVTFNRTTYEEKTSTWTTQATKPGYHRWVVAGTAHVFGVVGYDMSTKSYFVYTYSVMDNETHEFEDYSYTTAAYNDNQNGVISFEIPYEVTEYVTELTAASEGLKIDRSTGKITAYTGTDNCVVIPEYLNVGNGEVIKVTGIEASAFRGKTHILGVILSDFVTEIPDDAFNGCSSLIYVSGGSVTKVGARAFSGCTSGEKLGIRSSITELGDDAFTGVDSLIVNAANAKVLQAAVNSGAKKIAINTYFIPNASEALSNLDLTVPEGTEYFEFNGEGNTYNNLTIRSDADKTVINKATFCSDNKIPLQISSDEVVLNGVTVSAAGIAMVLTAEEASVGLQGTNRVQSETENGMLAKGMNLYEVNPNLVGKLIVEDKLLTCGTITDESLLSYGSLSRIDTATFENMLHSYTLYFDPNGGSCEEDSRVVANSTPVGELPVPARQYYTFTGWCLENGTEVTADTVFSTGKDVTVIAQWTPNNFTLTFDPNGGNCTVESQPMTYGEAIGTLPAATRDFYVFNGWYTAAEEGDQVTEDTVFADDADVTVYAQWTQNPLSDWVSADSVPEGAAVEQQKWAYTLTTKQESKATSLDGYVQTGSYWVQSGTGSANYASFPSGFDTGNTIYKTFAKAAYTTSETTTSKREVSNTWAGYVYWHWMYDCGTGGGLSTRAIYNQKGNGPTNGFYYKFFGAFTSTKGDYSSSRDYCNSLNIQNFIIPERSAYADCQGALRWFRFDYYKSTYTDYYKMFQYQKTEKLESITQVTAGTNGNATISDVQELVRYRMK